MKNMPNLKLTSMLEPIVVLVVTPALKATVAQDYQRQSQALVVHQNPTLLRRQDTAHQVFRVSTGTSNPKKNYSKTVTSTAKFGSDMDSKPLVTNFFYLKK